MIVLVTDGSKSDFSGQSGRKSAFAKIVKFSPGFRNPWLVFLFPKVKSFQIDRQPGSEPPGSSGLNWRSTILITIKISCLFLGNVLSWISVQTNCNKGWIKSISPAGWGLPLPRKNPAEAQQRTGFKIAFPRASPSLRPQFHREISFQSLPLLSPYCCQPFFPYNQVVLAFSWQVLSFFCRSNRQAVHSMKFPKWSRGDQGRNTVLSSLYQVTVC